MTDDHEQTKRRLQRRPHSGSNLSGIRAGSNLSGLSRGTIQDAGHIYGAAFVDSGELEVWGLPDDRIPTSSLDGRRVKTEQEIEAEIPVEHDKGRVYSIGLDLGGLSAKSDPCAVSILSIAYREEEAYGRLEACRRFRPKMFGGIPKAVAGVYTKLKNNATKHGGTFDATLYVDATSGGAPITESIRKVLPSAEIVGVVIGPGRGVTVHSDTSSISVAKQRLLSNFIIALQGENLKIGSRSKEVDALIHELTSLELKPTPSEQDMTFSGIGTSADDMAISLMLSCLALDVEVSGSVLRMWGA